MLIENFVMHASRSRRTCRRKRIVFYYYLCSCFFYWLIVTFPYFYSISCLSSYVLSSQLLLPPPLFLIFTYYNVPTAVLGLKNILRLLKSWSWLVKPVLWPNNVTFLLRWNSNWSSVSLYCILSLSFDRYYNFILPP